MIFFSFGSTHVPPGFLLHNHKDGTQTFLSGWVSAQSVLSLKVTIFFAFNGGALIVNGWIWFRSCSKVCAPLAQIVDCSARNEYLLKGWANACESQSIINTLAAKEWFSKAFPECRWTDVDGFNHPQTTSYYTGCFRAMTSCKLAWDNT